MGNPCFGTRGGTGHAGSRSPLGHPSGEAREGPGCEIYRDVIVMGFAGEEGGERVTHSHRPAAHPPVLAPAPSLTWREAPRCVAATFLPGSQRSTASASPAPDDEFQAQPVGQSPPQLGPGLARLIDRRLAGVSRSLVSPVAAFSLNGMPASLRSVRPPSPDHLPCSPLKSCLFP